MLEAAEGRRRLRALTERAGSNADAVLCMSPENIYFFTGFRTMLYTRFTAVLVRLDRPEAPVLVALSVDRRLIEDRVWSPTWVEQIAYHGTDPLPDVAPTPATALAPHLSGIRRLGVDSLRLSDLVELELAAPGVEIVQMTSVIDSLKLIKGHQELTWLRQANALAMQGIEQARAMLETGSTTELEIAVHLEATARLAGADGFGYPTLVSCGPKMCAVHSPSLPLPVEPGQPLRIAFGPTVEGYTADVVRTLCLNEPPSLLIRLQDGFQAARESLLTLIRPGVSVPQLLAAVRTVYAERDLLGYWRNNIGHGLGLTIHEPPKVGGASESVLEQGMVIAIEPSLFVPGFGGYAHCDVVHVTETGSELLTPGLEGIVRAQR
jgi:Xaa-Pro aminopeptidase